MKTDALIDLLANDVPRLPPGLAWRRLAMAVLLGGAVAIAAVVLWLGCQPLLVAASQPWFWMKATYTALLTATGMAIVRRLATPGAPLRAAPGWAIVVVAVMSMLGAAQLLAAEPAARPDLWLGHTWKVCSPLILVLSIPIYAALVTAVRSLAPTTPVRAGAGVGFAAGALAATLYGLHCPEQGAAFVATWYSLGIVAATVGGAIAGRWLLRW